MAVSRQRTCWRVPLLMTHCKWLPRMEPCRKWQIMSSIFFFPNTTNTHDAYNTCSQINGVCNDCGTSFLSFLGKVLQRFANITNKHAKPLWNVPSKTNSSYLILLGGFELCNSWCFLKASSKKSVFHKPSRINFAIHSPSLDPYKHMVFQSPFYDQTLPLPTVNKCGW